MNVDSIINRFDISQLWVIYSGKIIQGIYSVILALILLFVASHIAEGVKKRFYKTAEKMSDKIDQTLVPIFASVAKYSIWGVALLIVLDIFGVNTNSIIAILGAAGIAVGLALKETLQNIASGIMLIFLRPFRVGETIECGAVAGTVDEINLFTTIMKSADGLYLSVPNNLLWGATVKNFNRNKTRQINLPIGISYRDNVDKAFVLILEIIKADDRILQKPEPQVVLEKLADSSVNLSVRCWTNIESYWSVIYDLNKKIKVEIENAGMSLPFPQREVYVHEISTDAKLVR